MKAWRFPSSASRASESCFAVACPLYPTMGKVNHVTKVRHHCPNSSNKFFLQGEMWGAIGKHWLEVWLGLHVKDLRWNEIITRKAPWRCVPSYLVEWWKNLSYASQRLGKMMFDVRTTCDRDLDNCQGVCHRDRALTIDITQRIEKHFVVWKARMRCYNFSSRWGARR